MSYKANRARRRSSGDRLRARIFGWSNDLNAGDSQMFFKATLLAASLLVAALNPDQISAVKDHYLALGSEAIEAKPAAAPAAAKVERVDASQHIRSASFGHKTTLLIDKAQPTQYWVEYGKSTNTPAATYGPFTVQPPK
jgi:hypothetical protein